ncbi:MAG: hypothetical protein ABI036_08110 [Fibrobacteria bacterium]
MPFLFDCGPFAMEAKSRSKDSYDPSNCVDITKMPDGTELHGCKSGFTPQTWHSMGVKSDSDRARMENKIVIWGYGPASKIEIENQAMTVWPTKPGGYGDSVGVELGKTGRDEIDLIIKSIPAGAFGSFYLKDCGLRMILVANAKKEIAVDGCFYGWGPVVDSLGKLYTLLNKHIPAILLKQNSPNVPEKELRGLEVK